MWTPLSRLPLVRDRMQLDAIEGDDMDHEDSYTEDEIPARYEPDVELEAEVEKIVDEPVDGDMMRIRIGVNVSPYKRGDEMTVERDNEFFAGLVSQNLAEVIG